ncbi:MAG: flagellar brake domain-containing protein [Candidatus Omnitrophica bacterium]|nr:flagellar brake domain-containing protein [Candidatus Omnitrophota bacterium]
MSPLKKEYKKIDALLEVNRPIQFTLSGKSRSYVYKSFIAEIDSGSIYVMPVVRGTGHVPPLHNGDAINVKYFGRDAMYEFLSQITGERKDGNVILTVLEKPHKCWRVQRREFFRLPCVVDAHFLKASLEEQRGKKTFITHDKPIACVIDDISGGGISFHTLEVLAEGSFIEIEFNLPDEEADQHITEIVTLVRTKRVKALKQKGDFEYTYGGHFTLLDENTRGKIIRFIIRKQIQHRRVS